MAERHNPSQLDVHIEHLEGEFAPQLMYEEDSLITVSASAPAIPAQPGHETTEDWNMEQWFAGLPSGDLLLDYDLPMLFDEPIDVDVNGEEFLAAFTQAIMEAPPLGGVPYDSVQSGQAALSESELGLQQFLKSFQSPTATSDSDLPYMLDLPSIGTSADVLQQTTVDQNGGQHD